MGTARKEKRPGLTPRQQRFVEEYLIDLNATQAAVRAGYSAKTALQQGPRLLGYAGIATAIAEGKRARSADTGITQKRVLEELALLAFSNVMHYDVDENGRLTLLPGAPAGAERAVSSIKRRVQYDTKGQKTVEVEWKLWDKPGQLKLAGRHTSTPGFFDKIELTGKDGGPVEVRSVRDLSSGERRKRIAELAAKRGG